MRYLKVNFLRGIFEVLGIGKRVGEDGNWKIIRTPFPAMEVGVNASLIN